MPVRTKWTVYWIDEHGNPRAAQVYLTEKELAAVESALAEHNVTGMDIEFSKPETLTLAQLGKILRARFGITGFFGPKDWRPE